MSVDWKNPSDEDVFAALEAHTARSDEFWGQTSYGRSRAGGSDPWGEALDRKQRGETPKLAPAEAARLKAAEKSWEERSLLLAPHSDPDEVAALLADPRLQQIPAGNQRIAAARGLELAMRAWQSDSYDDLVKIAQTSGHGAWIMETIGEIERAEGLDGEGSFDEWASAKGAQFEEKALADVTNEIRSSLERHKIIGGDGAVLNPDAMQLAVTVLEAAEASEGSINVDQARALVDAAARGARQISVEDEKESILAQFEEGVRLTPGATTEESSDEMYGVETAPDYAERDADLVERVKNVGLAMAQTQTEGEAVVDAFNSQMAEQEERASGWQAVQQQAADLAADPENAGSQN